MTGMRERVRQFGGNMTIESNSRGTIISFTLPVAKTEPSKRAPVVQPVSVG